MLIVALSAMRIVYTAWVLEGRCRSGTWSP
jgi:hypothetical protein